MILRQTDLQASISIDAATIQFFVLPTGRPFCQEMATANLAFECRRARSPAQSKPALARDGLSRLQEVRANSGLLGPSVRCNAWTAAYKKAEELSTAKAHEQQLRKNHPFWQNDGARIRESRIGAWCVFIRCL